MLSRVVPRRVAVEMAEEERKGRGRKGRERKGRTVGRARAE